MRDTRHVGRPGPDTRSGTEPGPRTGSDAHRDHGHDDRCGDVGGGLFAGFPSGSGQVPSHGEISSLIAVTAAANLVLATRRVFGRRRAGHEDGPVDRRSH
ncbi:hypothetical protein [Streptomyces viridosporus]|uniref:Uncharacterized protein n=1 Tax=Streptomyces viridosporus T7A TaxID=665577 RepID=A0ABX6A7Q3_STRVD|nr:hypothetical protein [Streptomyces viridosporus]QEU83711.1 hypothetical protein CP969_02525 [Streptomyces viridosporus T7A]